MANKIFFCLVWASSLWSQAILPPADFLPGWAPCEAPRRFIQQDLFNHIDGGADLFIEFGFVDLVVQSYCHGEDEIGLEIYRMTSPAAALGIYLMKRDAGSDTCGAFRYSGNLMQLTAVKGDYFCLVNNFAGGSEQQPAMMAVLSQFLAPVESADLAVLFAPLPSQHLVAGSERLIRGPYALQSIFTLGPDDILQLGGQLFAVAGDYKVNYDSTWTLIMVNYSNAEVLRSAWIHLQSNLDPYLKIVQQDETAFVFRDYEDLFGRVWKEGNSIMIALHLKQVAK